MKCIVVFLCLAFAMAINANPVPRFSNHFDAADREETERSKPSDVWPYVEAERPELVDFVPAEERVPQPSGDQTPTAGLNTSGSTTMLDSENGNSGDRNTEDDNLECGNSGDPDICLIREITFGEFLSAAGQKVANAFAGWWRGISRWITSTLDIIAAL